MIGRVTRPDLRVFFIEPPMPRALREIILGIILIGAGLILVFTVGKDTSGGIIGRVVYACARPFQQGYFTIHTGVKNLWSDYAGFRAAAEENRALKEETRRLRAERTALAAKEIENQRLRKLLALKTRVEYPSAPAQIIGEGASGWYRMVFINKGQDDGVGPDMAVIVPEGVVGRTMSGSASLSRTLLLTDPGFSLDCRIVGTRDRGILNGSLEKGCVLRFIPLGSKVAPGDQVVTSGLDGIFPKGIPVGKIEHVSRAPQGLFLEAAVTPAVDVSQLEEALVVLSAKGGFDAQPDPELSR